MCSVKFLLAFLFSCCCTFGMQEEPMPQEETTSSVAGCKNLYSLAVKAMTTFEELNNQEKELFFDGVNCWYNDFAKEQEYSHEGLIHFAKNSGFLQQIESDMIEKIHEHQKKEMEESKNLPVGIIKVENPLKNEEYSIGSGLLISDRHVLTAQHVLDVNFQSTHANINNVFVKRKKRIHSN